MSLVANRPSVVSSDAVDEISHTLRRDRRRARVRRFVLSIATPVVLLGLWEILSRTGVFDARFFPPPTVIVENAGKFITDPAERSELLGHLSVSAIRLFAGFLIGGIAGLIIGLAMGLWRPANDALELLIYATYPLPKVTLFPLMIIFFGIGDSSKIALVALGVFFMLAINTTLGVSQSNAIYADVSAAFRLPMPVRFRKVIIPAAMPSIMAGARLAFGQGLILVVSTEFLAANEGVGYLIWNSWEVLDVPAMFVGLAIVGIVGAVSAWVFNLLGRWLLPWSDDK